MQMLAPYVHHGDAPLPQHVLCALSQCSPRWESMTADEWNAAYPVGTPVEFWYGMHDGPGEESVTRTPAWTLGCGDAVVSVEGCTGGVYLTHVQPLRPACEDCHGQGWVSVPCVRDPECAGCSACDRRCRSCDAGRVA